MRDIARYIRYLASGTWASKAPGDSRLSWRRLAGAWLATNVAVAVLFAVLAGFELLGGVAVALLWPFAQAAVLLGLGYAARAERRSERVS